jgi:hypothetical protein
MTRTARATACLALALIGTLHASGQTVPLANAGLDRTATLGDAVTLDGSLSSAPDGSPLTYLWALEIKPEGSGAFLSHPASVRPTFLVDVSGSYVLSLVVRSGAQESTPDYVVVTVANRPPVADAGPDASGRVGEVAVLDGTQSFDPDFDRLDYQWTFIVKPDCSRATLAATDSASADFVLDCPGAYLAALQVSDGFASSRDWVLVTTVNAAPTAHAGADQTTVSGRSVRLDGSRSSDRDANPLTYAWSIASRPAGSLALLVQADTAFPSFVPDVQGAYRVRLVVNDGVLDSVADTVVISTINSAPLAEAGPDQRVVAGDIVRLDASRSTDPDSQMLRFTWTFASRPPSSSAALDNTTALRPSFVADAPGSYDLRLTVHDGLVTSAADVVRVTTDNAAPVADAGFDQTVPVGSLVRVSGAGSTDADGAELGFRWAMIGQPTGSTAALFNVMAVRPAFIPDVPGTYILQLIVTDGGAISEPDTVIVTTENVAPRADAGPDQTIPAGNTAVLDAAGSQDANDDPLTYHWALVARPAGSNARVVPDTAVTALTADVAGTYVMSLAVSDSTLTSAPDTVVITTENSVPVADAGPYQEPPAGTVVTLDGSGSSDADAAPLLYRWSFIVRPFNSRASLSDPASPTPTFLADVAGTYIAQLIVNDFFTSSQPSTVLIVAVNRRNDPPTADAGPDQRIAPGSGVQLDGSASTDPDDDTLTYRWTLTTPPGSSAVLDDTNSVAPTFVADVRGTYDAQLVVNDGEFSATDAVRIAANQRPAAEIAADATATVGDVVTLDGQGSSDPDSDPLTYAWTLTRPANSTAPLSNGQSAQASFVADVEGEYVVELIVNDNLDASDPATVHIVATPRPDQEIVCGDTRGGVIDRPGQRQEWTFVGNAGQAVVFAAVATGGALAPVIRFYDPTGILRYQTLPNRQSASVRLPVSGKYRIVVQDDNLLDTGSYNLNLQSSTGECGQAIACGGTLAGAVPGGSNHTGFPHAQQDSFTFTGKRNEAVVFAAVATSGLIAPVAELYDPTGVLRYRTLANRQSASVPLPIDGTYTLLVHDDNLMDGGTYNVAMQSTGGDCGRGISCGQTLASAVPGARNLTGSPHAQYDGYTFEGERGQAVVFAAVATDGAIAPVAELYDPNGTLRYRTLPNRQSASVPLPVAGTYTIVVHDDNLVDGGTYNVNMQSSSGRCGRPIGCGETLSETVPNDKTLTSKPHAEQDGYTFSGTPGEAVVFAAVATSGEIAPVTELYDPSGILRYRTLPNRQSAAVPLSTAGTYTIIVHDDNLVDGGTYNVNLQFSTGRCSVQLQCGIPVNGEIPGSDNQTEYPHAEQDAYAFEGTAGERVTFGAIATAGPLAAVAELYDSGGALRARTLPNRTVTVGLSVTGLYTILVHDDDLRDGGKYTVKYERVGGCPPVPAATVTPTSLEFGDQEVDTVSLPQTVTVTSSGTAPLSITDIAPGSPHFEAVGEAECKGGEHQPGHSCTFQIVFAPKAEGPLTDAVRILSNAPDSPHPVTLSGRGVPRPQCPIAINPELGFWFADFYDPIHGTGGSKGTFRFVGTARGIPSGGVVLKGEVTPNETSLIFQVSLAPGSRALEQVGTRFLSPLARVAVVAGAGWIPGNEPDGLIHFVGADESSGVDYAWLALDGLLQPEETTGLFFVALSSELVRPGLVIHYNVVEDLALGVTLGVKSAVVECGSDQCTPLPAGTVGWWTGNGFAGDAIAPAQHAALINGATFTPGKVQEAFDLDGIDDFVRIPDAPALRPAHITVDAWVNFKSLDGTVVGDAPSGLQYIVFKRNSRAGTNFEGYTLAKSRSPEGDRLSFVVTSADGTKAHLLSSTLVVAGQFYHVAGTFDGVEARLYVNGVLENTVRHEHPLDGSSEPLIIGRTNQPHFDGACHCLIDEVKVAARALEAAEIAAVFAAGGAGHCRERVLAFSAGDLSFDPQSIGTASSPKVVSITNVGTADVMIEAIESSPEFPSLGGRCPGTLSPGASCAIEVTFVPEAENLRSGVVTVSSDAIGSPHIIHVSGTVQRAGELTMDPPTVDFGDVVQGAVSDLITVTLRNAGGAPLEIHGWTTTAEYFVDTWDCPLAPAGQGALGAGASCTLNLRFATALTYVTGPRSGVLEITTNSGSTQEPVTTTHTVPLTGNAIGVPQTVVPAGPVDFGDVVQGTTSDTRPVTVQNSGAVPMEIHGWTTTAEYFVETWDCPLAPAGQGGLGAGASCTLNLRFAPALTYVTGPRSGALEITTNSGSTQGPVTTTHTVPLTGNAIGVPQAVVPAGPVDFGDVVQGTTSDTRPVTVQNSGAVPLEIHGWTTTAEYFVETWDCPRAPLRQGGLGAGASCTLNLRFAPETPGPRNGTLEITSNSGSTHGSVTMPHTVSLTGNGIEVPQVLLPAALIDSGKVLERQRGPRAPENRE